ncbi:MAG: tRNA pseudouridine(55) synthase TruB [Phycisphaerales bacterium]
MSEDDDISENRRSADVPAPKPTPMGLLVIDKPLRRSSMDVCRAVRRRLVAGGAPKRVKVGHGGTLDPLATGVLVILVGKATPLCERIMQGQKVYEARVDLSAFSTTDDAEGERTVVAAAPVERGALEAACAKFVGTVMQTPPIYSAMKVAGRRAYDLARKGHEVVLQPRLVRIDAIEVMAYAWPVAELRVTCGKGTYIRSLARDLGVALGTGGMLAGLRRTRVGEFGIERAVTVESLPQVMGQADLLAVPPGLAPPADFADPTDPAATAS